MAISVVEDTSSKGPVLSAKSLLSGERSQKFDLMLHLISNLSKPIILCGPDGIGKSIVLREIKAAKMDSWVICLVQASAKVGFEDILENIRGTAVVPSNSYSGGDALIGQLNRMQERHELLVLLLDDAGYLKPGVLKSICQFGESHSSLRLVFSMRPDHLHVQATTDFEIEDCHIVDLPPLTEAQCEEFLKNLSSDPQRSLSFKAVNPAFIDRVYRDTHGIPGKIMKDIPKFLEENAVSARKKFNFVYLPVAASLIIACGVFWWTEMYRNADNRAITTAPVAAIHESDGGGETAATNDPAIKLAPKIELPVLENSKTTTQTKFSQIERTDALSQTAEVTLDSPKTSKVEKTEQAAFTVLQPSESEAAQLSEEIRELAEDPPVEETKPGIKKPAESLLKGLRGEDWLLAQKPDDWTLQVIVLSRLDSLKALVNRHPDLRSWSVSEGKSGDKTLYYLFYGSYSSVKEAKLAANRLPSAVRKSWPRTFKSVQSDIQSLSKD